MATPKNAKENTVSRYIEIQPINFDGLIKELDNVRIRWWECKKKKEKKLGLHIRNGLFKAGKLIVYRKNLHIKWVAQAVKNHLMAAGTISKLSYRNALGDNKEVAESDFCKEMLREESSLLKQSWGWIESSPQFLTQYKEQLVQTVNELKRLYNLLVRIINAFDKDEAEVVQQINKILEFQDVDCTQTVDREILGWLTKQKI